MKVKDVMTADVKACRPETNAAEAVKMMWDQDCGVLPIVSSDGKVVGMAKGGLKGILSMNDVVLHSGAASPNQIVDTLAGICAHRRKPAVAGAA